MAFTEYFTWNFPIHLFHILSPLLHLRFRILRFYLFFPFLDKPTRLLFYFCFEGLYIFQILRCLTLTQTKTQFQKRLMTRTRLKPSNNSNCTTLSSSPFPSVSHLSSSLSSTSFIYVDEAAASTGLLLECVAVVALFPPTISQR